MQIGSKALLALLDSLDALSGILVLALWKGGAFDEGVDEAGAIEILIEDDGPGFDYSRFTTYDASRTLDPHGRGILLARAMFEVEYIDPGNKVRVTVPHSDDSGNLCRAAKPQRTQS